MQTNNAHAKQQSQYISATTKKQIFYLKKTLYQKNTVHTHEPHSSEQLQGQRSDYASQMDILQRCSLQDTHILSRDSSYISILKQLS